MTSERDLKTSESVCELWLDPVVPGVCVCERVCASADDLWQSPVAALMKGRPNLWLCQVHCFDLDTEQTLN